MTPFAISLLILVQTVCTRVTADDIIIVADLVNASIWTGPIDTLELVKIPLDNLLNPVAVDYDPVEQKVYWTDVVRKTISKAKLDGTESQVVVSFLSVPDGITIDSENRHIYWTDAGTDTIERANLDGSGRMVIVDEGHDEPRAIAVDSAAEHIYWTDWGENPKIERANLNGGDRTILVSTDLRLPNGLVIDFADRRLYWCEAGLNRIETTNLDGGDRRLLFTISNPDIHPFDIGIYDTNIYWSDWALTKVIRMDKYAGGQAEAVGPAVFARAGGLHIHQDHDGSCATHTCLNGGRCRQLIQGYQCVCPSGYTGEFCDEILMDTNECSSGPCFNGGQCLDGQSKYICNCETTGWQGDRCEIDTDECIQDPNACHTNAICTNTDGSYTCQCRPGYTGDGQSCSAVPVDDCNTNPCLNGQCVVGLLSLNYFCNCESGWQGERCEIALVATRPTDSNGCQHPGNLVNGHVFPDADRYTPGEKVEYLCADGYIREGRDSAYCQSDYTWSHDRPICISKDGSVSSQHIVIGGGAAGGLVIIVLILILLFVCFRKSSRSATTEPDIRHQLNQAPKDDGHYNTAFDSAAVTATIHRNPNPNPDYAVSIISHHPHPPTLTRHSQHLYDEVGNHLPLQPPAYEHDEAAGANHDQAVESHYAHMRGNVKVDK